MWLFNSKLRCAVRSPKWTQVRKQHIEDNPCCAACGSCNKPEVHHIVPVHVDPSKELDPSNLITLCDKYCHFVFGHFMNWHSWNSTIVEDSRSFLQKIKSRP